MREHQIVISLKPEQFQEVQRQARAAGSKSVGIFVRQKLIASLGLDPSKKDENTSPGATTAATDWRFISYELRRLHRELKVLLAESAGEGTFQGKDESAALIQAASQVAMPEGAPHSREDFLAGTVPVMRENFLTEGAPFLPEPPADHALPAQADFKTETSKYDLGTPAVLPASLPPVVPAGATSQPEPVKPVLEQRDDLEVLADRAFAISPRLGPIEPTPPPSTFATRSFADTLNDLLDEGLISQVTTSEEAARNLAGDVEDPPAPRRQIDIESLSNDVAPAASEVKPVAADEEAEALAQESGARPQEVSETPAQEEAAGAKIQQETAEEPAEETSAAVNPAGEDGQVVRQPPHSLSQSGQDEDGGTPPVPPPKRRRSS